MLNEHDIKDYKTEFADYQPTVAQVPLTGLDHNQYFKIVGYPFMLRLEHFNGHSAECIIAEGPQFGKGIVLPFNINVFHWNKND